MSIKSKTEGERAMQIKSLSKIMIFVVIVIFISCGRNLGVEEFTQSDLNYIKYKKDLSQDFFTYKNNNTFEFIGIEKLDVENNHYKEVIENFGINLLYGNENKDDSIQCDNQEELATNDIKYYYSLIDLDDDNKKELVLLLNTEKKNFYEDLDVKPLIEIYELWTSDKNEILEIAHNESIGNDREWYDSKYSIYINDNFKIVIYNFLSGICYSEYIKIYQLKNKELKLIDDFKTTPGPTDVPMHFHKYKKINYEKYNNVILESISRVDAINQNKKIDFIEVTIIKK